MKITISMPDALFNAAEKLAKRFGVSRSEFYQRAMRLYVEQHRANCITESLDALYGGAATETRLDSVIEHLQGVSLATSDW